MLMCVSYTAEQVDVDVAVAVASCFCVVLFVASVRYIFGAYPHGILILSRAATYGGIWEKLFPGIDFRVLGASPM